MIARTKMVMEMAKRTKMTRTIQDTDTVKVIAAMTDEDEDVTKKMTEDAILMAAIAILMLKVGMRKTREDAIRTVVIARTKSRDVATKSKEDVKKWSEDVKKSKEDGKRMREDAIHMVVRTKMITVMVAKTVMDRTRTATAKKTETETVAMTKVTVKTVDEEDNPVDEDRVVAMVVMTKTMLASVLKPNDDDTNKKLLDATKRLDARLRPDVKRKKDARLRPDVTKNRDVDPEAPEATLASTLPPRPAPVINGNAEAASASHSALTAMAVAIALISLMNKTVVSL